MIILLPERERANLEDFAKVIMINLSVALLTAYLFVPSLIDKFPGRKPSATRSFRRRRRIVAWSHTYGAFIKWGRKHRAVYITAFVAAFGIPLFLLPDRRRTGDEKRRQQGTDQSPSHFTLPSLLKSHF